MPLIQQAEMKNPANSGVFQNVELGILLFMFPLQQNATVLYKERSKYQAEDG